VQVDEVSVPIVWDRLKSDPNAVLIDVRTKAEWAFVGFPDLSPIGKRVVMVEWQTFPDNRIDPLFVAKLSEFLDSVGVAKEDDLYFICRSGSRSKFAAEAMIGAGYQRCHNVTEGFEGPLDASRHRGKASGWKVAGLPWVQG